MQIKALQVFKHDDRKETDGVWCPIAPGVEWRIRRMRSKPVEEAKERLYGPYERVMNKNLPEALETDLTCKLLSQAVVVDWRGEGMVNDSGEPVPFSVELAEALLKDKDTGKDLRATIISLAMDSEQFRPDSQDVKDDAKN